MCLNENKTWAALLWVQFLPKADFHISNQQDAGLSPVWVSVCVCMNLIPIAQA